MYYLTIKNKPMSNLNSPAYPFQTYDTVNNGVGVSIPITYTDANQSGFTKLELASLMIAQGSIQECDSFNQHSAFAAYCVNVAKAVLEEANKEEVNNG